MGGVPSGSRCAARWPCIRNAFTNAIAAATWYSISGAIGPADSSRLGAGGGLRPARSSRRESCRLSVDQLVEPLVALEQVVQGREERPRLRTLDDAVVVGAGDGHDLADAELAEPLVGHAAELGRVADRADRDDAPLAGHEPGHRGDRAEAARIGERHGGAGEIVRHELVGARLLDQRLVGGVEGGEVEGVGALDHRHHQAAAAVLPLHVYREAQADALGLYPEVGAVVVHGGCGP